MTPDIPRVTCGFRTLVCDELCKPCLFVIGGRPAERCRSDALFLTLKARSWVISTGILDVGDVLIRFSEL